MHSTRKAPTSTAKQAQIKTLIVTAGIYINDLGNRLYCLDPPSNGCIPIAQSSNPPCFLLAKIMSCRTVFNWVSTSQKYNNAQGKDSETTKELDPTGAGQCGNSNLPFWHGAIRFDYAQDLWSAGMLTGYLSTDDLDCRHVSSPTGEGVTDDNAIWILMGNPGRLCPPELGTVPCNSVISMNESD